MFNQAMYPCSVCDEECIDSVVQCGDCEKWVHSQCVPMSNDLLQKWSDANLKFLCRTCCYTDNQFDPIKSLQRLGAVIGQAPRTVRKVTRSEILLLETYQQEIPEPVDSIIHMAIDRPSELILQKFCPAVLSGVYPAETYGDGNCLYRAVSRAISGSETLHVLLRVFTLLEVLTFPMFYDEKHKNFIDIVKDNRIVCADYIHLAKDIAGLGRYADMMHLYALSAAMGTSIRSFFPPQLNMEFVSEPYSRKVCGRGVVDSCPPACTIMWTSGVVPNGLAFVPNHFVPLMRRFQEAAPEVIDISDISSTDRKSAESLVPEARPDHTDETDCHSAESLTPEKSDPYSAESFVPEDLTDQTDHYSAESFVPEDRPDESDNVHPLSHGSLDKGVLDATDVINMLSSFTYTEAHDSIPQGIKNDVYFVVKNDLNIENRRKGARSTFSDDCGVWDYSKGATPKTFYVRGIDETLKAVYKKADQYCYAKKVKGKKTFVPMDPQPASEIIIELIRNYSTSKKDPSYKRRVSWLGQGAMANLAIIEYSGKYPGLAPHGNAKEGTEYIRTPSTVMSEMSDMLQRDNPLNVYNKLVLKHDVLSGPSKRKQVYDKKYNDAKRQRKNETGQVIRRGNIADHINEIDKMLAQENTIVKSIIRDYGKAPCLILYTQDQLDDIKNICCSGQSILGIDKTFNLCDLHVTASCYKQVTVNMDSTKEPPIFLGPIFIHDNSDFETFSVFFNHLKIKLIGTDTDNLTFGTDEEVALVNAITTAFPDSGHVLCARHLRQNCKQKLIDDCIDKTDREHILDDIFGQTGLLNADDTVCFDVQCEALESKCKELSSKFHRYFDTRLKPNLMEQRSVDVPCGYFDRNWTNNNCESLNHVLKRAIDWKSKPLLDLVEILQDIVDTQYKELMRSLVSMGQYRVADTHLHFAISKSAWASKTQEERQRLVRRFRSFVPKDARTVTSTDGMTVLKPRTHGRKIGQRRRRINERTTTFKRT